MGTLSFLWHESQAMEVTVATAFQVSLWTDLEGEELDKFLQNACELKYLTKKENGFYIHGNSDQLVAIREHKARMKKARKSRWKTDKRPERPKSKGSAGEQCIDQYTDQCTDQSQKQCISHNAMQFNAIQGKAKQSKADLNTSQGVTPPRADGKSLGSKIWEVYENEFRKKHNGTSPVRNAKTNSQCVDIGRRLGEEALDVVKFYFRHPGQKYANAMHALGFLQQDAEILSAQWRTKKVAPTGYSNQQSNSEHNMSQLQRIERGEL